jgi:MFS family permease
VAAEPSPAAEAAARSEPVPDPLVDTTGATASAAPALAGGPSASPFRPFRYRNYSLLWSGSLVSLIGSWMQTVAVGALVISDTGKALWAVLVAAGAFLPIGLLSPLGGALADRVARRPVIVGGNVVAGLVALVIAWLVSHGHDAPGLLLLLVTIQGSVSALIGPFQQVILPDLVPREDFLAASSLSSANWNLGRVVGPTLAGVTIAAFGYPMAFLVNAASFLAVVIAMAFIKLSPPPRPPAGERIISSLRSGLSAARRQPACWSAILTIAVVAVLASPFIALVPAVARRLVSGPGAHFLTSPAGHRAVASATAWLTTAQGVGAVLGALLLTPVAARFGRGRVLVCALFVLEPVLVLYGMAPDLAAGVVLLFLVGLVYIAVLSGLNTVIQLRAPEGFRGRVLGIYSVALGVAYPIGSLIQGPLADRIGLPWTTAATALLLLAILGALALRRHTILRELAGAFS